MKIWSRLNPIISDDPNTFGIVFNFADGDVSYQKICSDCLATSENSDEGQTVNPSVFTIEFHKKFKNIDESEPDNVQELFNRVGGQEMGIESIRWDFNSKKTLINLEFRYLRDRYTDLEQKLSLEIKFWKERSDKKFLYNDEDQRRCTGLSKEEFDHVATFVKPFERHFHTFDYQESLNLLLTCIR